MDSIEIISFYSAYVTNASSVYDLAPPPLVKDKQESSAEQNPLANLSEAEDLVDEAIISNAAMALLAKDKEDASNASLKEESTLKEQPKDTSSKTKEELTPEQKQEVAELKNRDAEVKAHEQAHIAAAGGIMVSGPTYNYETGPDGKKYAVEGEVDINLTQSASPEENLAKAETMKAAALAPAQPSSQDLAVARKAEQLIQKAKDEITEAKSEEIKTEDKPVKADSAEPVKTNESIAEEASLKLEG